MPHAQKNLGPLLDLLGDPLFQIISAVGLLLNGVLSLLGNLVRNLHTSVLFVALCLWRRETNYGNYFSWTPLAWAVSSGTFLAALDSPRCSRGSAWASGLSSRTANKIHLSILSFLSFLSADEKVIIAQWCDIGFLMSIFCDYSFRNLMTLLA